METLTPPNTPLKLALRNSIIQGPLAGYSNSAMRSITHEWGAPDFCCSEMLSAKHLANHPEQMNHFTHKSDKEGVLCFQIAGNEPDHLVDAIHILSERGADLIDLNCGCPMRKIRRKELGSSLLKDSLRLEKILTAMRKATNKPLSIKIRVDGNSQERFHLRSAEVAEQAGFDFITVHGRHWQENYEDAVHLDQIAEIVDHISIPVIGNGDLSDAASIQHMQAQTGCTGFMISRAGVGQPWLSKQIKAELVGERFEIPDTQTIGQILCEHVRRLCDLNGEHSALLQARKLAKYYARNRVSPEFIQRAKQLNTEQELQDLVGEYFA